MLTIKKLQVLNVFPESQKKISPFEFDYGYKEQKDLAILQ